MYYQFIFRSFVRIGHSWKESYKVNFIFAVRILRCISMKYSALSDEGFQLHWHIEELNMCLNRRLIVILSWLPFQSCKFLIRPSVEPCGRRSKKRAFGDEPIVFLPRRRFRFFFFFSFFSAKAETFSLSRVSRQEEMIPTRDFLTSDSGGRWPPFERGMRNTTSYPRPIYAGNRHSAMVVVSRRIHNCHASSCP